MDHSETGVPTTGVDEASWAALCFLRSATVFPPFLNSSCLTYGYVYPYICIDTDVAQMLCPSRGFLHLFSEKGLNRGEIR